MYSLREVTYDDIEIINSWRNNLDLINNLGAPFRFINIETDKTWFESYMKSRNSNIRCSILNQNGDVIGLVSLLNINYINQSATLHIMIGENGNTGKGAGNFAVEAMLNHAFLNINLNRIELSVLINNKRAINLYEKIGFQTEGIKREVFYKNGKFENAIIMSILKKEYIEVNSVC